MQASPVYKCHQLLRCIVYPSSVLQLPAHLCAVAAAAEFCLKDTSCIIRCIKQQAACCQSSCMSCASPEVDACAMKSLSKRLCGHTLQVGPLQSDPSCGPSSLQPRPSQQAAEVQQRNAPAGSSNTPELCNDAIGMSLCKPPILQKVVVYVSDTACASTERHQDISL